LSPSAVLVVAALGEQRTGGVFIAHEAPQERRVIDDGALEVEDASFEF
jgi:hypothetical protein